MFSMRSRPKMMRQRRRAALELDCEVEEMTGLSDSATIVTSHGDIKVKLFPNDTPITVKNFAKLARRKFYDGLLFHRVVRDFVIQGGCPKGDGTGGPGYTFQDEIRGHLKHDRPYTLSM